MKTPAQRRAVILGRASTQPCPSRAGKLRQLAHETESIVELHGTVRHI